MNNKTWWTWLSGVAFIVVLIISFVLQGDGVDPTEDSARDVIAYYQDKDSELWVSAALELVAAALLVYFGSHLRHLLRRAETLAPAVFAGTIIVAVAAGIDATITVTLLELTDDPDVAIAPGAIQALSGLFNNDYMPIALGMAVFGTAAGLAIVRTGALPKWIGWIALVIGVVAFTPAGFFSFPATGLWIIGVSIFMAVRAKQAGPGWGEPGV